MMGSGLILYFSDTFTVQKKLCCIIFTIIAAIHGVVEYNSMNIHLVVVTGTNLHTVSE